MPVEVIMPKMGMTMEEGTVLQWFKQEGEHVEKGQPLLEIMTDKINVEVEAPATGVLRGVIAGANDTVPATSVIAYIFEPGEVDSGKVAAATSAPPPAQATSRVEPAAPAPPQPGERGMVPASPLARRLAREAGLDLAGIRGSGPAGRVTEADVKAAIDGAQRPVAAPTQPLQPSLPAVSPIAARPVPVSQPALLLNGRPMALTGRRKVIAQRMALSAGVPQFALGVDADMTQAEQARGAFSPTAMLVRAVAHALQQHALLNASFAEGSIVVHDEINVGVAVSADDGLVVPVVKNAESKRLPALDVEIKDLAERTRSGKLDLSDVTGATFTISNLGMLGIEEFKALVNPPEAAILAVGRIMAKPVVVAGAVVVRPMLHLVLSADHRVVDGAMAAAFLMDVKSLLENPYLLL